MTQNFKPIFLSLLVLFSLSSCGQTSTSNNPPSKINGMIDYFDSSNQILFKLYKKNPKGIVYWEIWNNSDISAIAHWGLLGDYGDKKHITESNLVSLKQSVNSLITNKIKEGYSEIAYDKQFTLSITFKLKTWGNSDDLERREKYRNIITENLGWTGNGRCDDGDIGSNEMALYAEVVDPYLAIKTISKELIAKEIKDTCYFSISQGDKIIAKKILPTEMLKH